MFSKDKGDKKVEKKDGSPRNNHIEQGTKVVGDLITTGSLRHDGEMEGNIIADQKVVLGPTCRMVGNLKATSAEISGEVNGTVEISDLLTIKASGIINGDIIANKMTIEPGGMFNGTSKMGAVVKDINQDDRKQQQGQGRRQDRSA